MTFLEISLDETQTLVKDWECEKFTPGKKYVVTTEYEGLEGKPFCAYIGVIFRWGKGFNEKRIEWLNDFSGSKKHVKLTFIARTEKATLIYNINNQTHKKSKCKFNLLPLESVSIMETNQNELQELPESECYVAQKLPELSPEEELSLEKNLVWVISSTRSGSTWLSKYLLSFKTNYINEPNLSQYLGLKAPPISDKNTDMEYFSQRPDYFFSFRYKNTWLFYLRKLILNRIHAQVNDFSKKIIIQEPGGLGFLTISECLSYSKIIVLFRDGRDVVDSQLDPRINLPPKGRLSMQIEEPLGKQGRSDFVREQSKHWVKTMTVLQLACKSHPKGKLFVTKYEELLNNTLEETLKIYKFLGIGIPKDYLRKKIDQASFEKQPDNKKGPGLSLRFATPGKWKENLFEEEKQIMEEIMGSKLKDLGY